MIFQDNLSAEEKSLNNRLMMERVDYIPADRRCYKEVAHSFTASHFESNDSKTAEAAHDCFTVVNTVLSLKG